MRRSANNTYACAHALARDWGTPASAGPSMNPPAAVQQRSSAATEERYRAILETLSFVLSQRATDQEAPNLANVRKLFAPSNLNRPACDPAPSAAAPSAPAIEHPAIAAAVGDAGGLNGTQRYFQALRHARH